MSARPARPAAQVRASRGDASLAVAAALPASPARARLNSWFHPVRRGLTRFGSVLRALFPVDRLLASAGLAAVLGSGEAVAHAAEGTLAAHPEQVGQLAIAGALWGFETHLVRDACLRRWPGRPLLRALVMQGPQGFVFDVAHTMITNGVHVTGRPLGGMLLAGLTVWAVSTPLVLGAEWLMQRRVPDTNRQVALVGLGMTLWQAAVSLWAA
ncbi:MAG: hypothetical protein HY696_07925 [Deltaproteobacteria bacterium]|nr:hypothetical protein [Deltaproteobacteria bacterium]